MGLCDLCQAIPWNNLPPAPSGTFDEGLLFWEWSSSPLPNPLVYVHHTSLEALRTAAEACDFCSLITAGAEESIEYLKFRMGKVNRSHYSEICRSLEYHLWITKRQDGAAGCMVWSTLANSDEIFLLAAFGLCVNDDDLLASLLSGRPVEEDAASDRVLKRAVRWVQSCSTHHEHCHVRDSPLPSRVLDVGDSSMPARIKLWESQGVEGTYIALSHCWGTSQHFTTSATIKARKTGIDVTDMPKTFQDAVFITKKLNVNYLWIDSLCVCQDDSREWERESSKMASIYANSYLTIAASHARDGTIGCLNRRPSRKHVTFGPLSIQGVVGFVQAFPLPLAKVRREWDNISLDNEPLSRRAWAFQERYLAPRTLHYGTDQMYFECRSEFLSEEGFRSKALHFILDRTNAPRRYSIAPLWYSGSTQWCGLIVNYANRDLTRRSDMLPALSGLARHFEEQLQGQYCTGLWRKEIIQGLLWEALEARPQSGEYLAPSWSWASLDGPIKITTGLNHFTDLTRVVDFHIKFKGDNPYGEVTNGRLVLQCPMEPLFPVAESEADWETIDSASDGSTSQELGTDQKPSARAWLRTRDESPSSFCAVFDDPADVSAVGTLPLFALPLAYPKFGEANFQALVANPSTKQGDCFGRVGITSLVVNTQQLWKWLDEEPDTLPIITLV